MHLTQLCLNNFQVDGDMKPGVRHKVSLKLCQIYVESPIKAERGRDGGHHLVIALSAARMFKAISIKQNEATLLLSYLAYQPVQVGIAGPLNVEVPPADVIDGLVVHHEGTVGVLQSGVGGQNSIVRLNDSSGNLWGRVDGELKLALLAIVHRQPLHEQGSESGSGASSEGMEEKESLESSTSVRQLPDTVKNEVDNLLSDGVVSSGVVVGGVLLSVDQLLRVVQLTVCSASGLVDDGGLQIDEDCSWDVLASASLGEEGLEGVIAEGLVGGHVAVGLDAMLEAVELPAGVSDLATGLADVDGDALTLGRS